MAAAVLPWDALGGLAAIAPVLRRPVADLATTMAGLPEDVEGLAVADGGRALAAGLWVPSNLAATGGVALAWLATAEGVPAEAAIALVAHAEARARAAGARALEVSERHAPGAAPLLEARGYRIVNAMLRLRRGRVRPALPLPAGAVERTLADAGVDTWVEVTNASFAGVPFSAPLTRAVAERLAASPGFAPALVRVAFDEGGAVGFLQGLVDEAGRGEVEAIGVVPRARGRGLGRWLLRRCEALLDDRGAREITLRVAQSNAPAIALYAAEGYAEVARSVAWERAL